MEVKGGKDQRVVEVPFLKKAVMLGLGRRRAAQGIPLGGTEGEVGEGVRLGGAGADGAEVDRLGGEAVWEG